MKVIHLMSGISGSGKSTYIRKMTEGESKHYVLHRDDVRASLRETYGVNKYFPVSPNDEFKFWIECCTAAIVSENANHFWFDQATLDNRAVIKFYTALFRSLREYNYSLYDYQFIIERLDCDVETALRQNANRSGYARVPDHVIYRMANAEAPNAKIREEFNEEWTLPVIYIHNIKKNITQSV